jgi:pimeloyl-ACP methyl ester carboxylesterase
MRFWLGTASIALAAVTALHAQAGQRQTAPPAAAPRAGAGSLERMTVQSDGHPMAVWARRPAAPKGAILLVHGLTWSARPDFDLQVPGMQRSVMTSFVSQGFAAYALDLRGYGETPRDATGWLTPRRAAADIANVVTWVGAQHPTLPKPTLVGWSRGAAMSAMVAQQHPTRLSHVVLFGFVMDPEAQFMDLPGPDKPQMLKNTPEAAASDFVSPKVTPPAVIKAYVEQALKADPVRMDLKNDGEFNFLKPAKLMVPTLVMYAENDSIDDAEAGKFFGGLGTRDKALVVLPGGDHAALIEDTHDLWIATIVNFIARPAIKH